VIHEDLFALVAEVESLGTKTFLDVLVRHGFSFTNDGEGFMAKIVTPTAGLLYQHDGGDMFSAAYIINSDCGLTPLTDECLSGMRRTYEDTRNRVRSNNG